MIVYSTLTAAQREQVQYLFADEHFGTDPNAFEYQLRGESVIGRGSLTANRSTLKARKPHTVRLNVLTQEVPDQYITVEMIRNSQQAITDIAREIAGRMIRIQKDA